MKKLIALIAVVSVMLFLVAKAKTNTNVFDRDAAGDGTN